MPNIKHKIDQTVEDIRLGRTAQQLAQVAITKFDPNADSVTVAIKRQTRHGLSPENYIYSAGQRAALIISQLSGQTYVFNAEASKLASTVTTQIGYGTYRPGWSPNFIAAVFDIAEAPRQLHLVESIDPTSNTPPKLEVDQAA